MWRALTVCGALRALLLALGLTLAALPQARGVSWLAPAAAAATAPTAGVVPDFVRTDLAGHTVRLSAYRGKLVLLSFWATWCEPCRAEAPRFSSWQQKFGLRGLQVVGISMDDGVAPVAKFVARYHLAYPIVMGDAQLAELFGGVLGLPLTFLIDPSGRIIERYRGEVDLNRMEARVAVLLSAPPP